LELFCQIEGVLRQREALFGRRRKEQDMLGITWLRNAVDNMSPCEVRVGRPVDGPTRWMSQMTAGIST